MRKEEFYYDSVYNTNKIHAVKWVPEGTPLCIIQIVHGMSEYIERYEEFASFLTEKNILVVGEDHLGHGKSMGNNPPGYFCKEQPHTVLVENVHKLKDMIKEEYPDIPYVVFGHSMGSFITRNFIHQYGTEIDGAVICGTGMLPNALIQAMRVMVNVLCAVKGEKAISQLVNTMAFGSYQKRISNPKTEYDWLSVNEENVEKYIADPLCGFSFTLNGFKGMAGLLNGLYDREKIEAMPKELPLYFICGGEDPVGDYGAGVEKSYKTYTGVGMTNVSNRVYPGKRHEILMEDNRWEVMNDVYTWVAKNVL